MPLPWLQTHRRGRRRDRLRAQPRERGRCTDEQQQPQQMRGGGARAGGLEARMAGVVVAALKEAFDRDTRAAGARARAARRRARARRARAAAGAAAAGRATARSDGCGCSPASPSRGWLVHAAARDLAGQPSWSATIAARASRSAAAGCSAPRSPRRSARRRAVAVARFAGGRRRATAAWSRCPAPAALRALAHRRRPDARRAGGADRVGRSPSKPRHYEYTALYVVALSCCSQPFSGLVPLTAIE